MGVSYQIDKKAGLVLTRAFGRIEDDDLLMHYHKLKQDPAFSDRLNHIIDLSEVKINGLTKDVLRDLDSITPFSTGSLRAVVAPQDDTYDFFNTPTSHLKALRRSEEAMDWIMGARV